MHAIQHLDNLPLDKMTRLSSDVKHLETVAESRGLVGKLVDIRIASIDSDDAFTSNMDGLYWITAKKQEDLDRILDSVELVKKGLRKPHESLIYQKILEEKFSNALDTRINIAPLTDKITADDAHAFIDECFHRINDMEIVWNSFNEFGLVPPEKITYTTLAVLKDNLIQRFKPYLTNAEFTVMTNLAKKNCENAINRFEKNQDLVIPRNIHEPHLVDKKYLLEKKIDYINDTVSPELVDYIKERWGKFPHYYMHIDKKPCIDTINYKASSLDDDEPYVLYNCMIPKQFADTFFAWKIGFWAENGEWPICSLQELGGTIGDYGPDGNAIPMNDRVRLFALTVEDSWTFFPELKKTGVKVAIYQGELKQPVTTNPMYFLYSGKDKAVIDEVLAKTRDQAVRECWFLNGKSHVRMQANINHETVDNAMELRREAELKADLKKLDSMQLCDKYTFSDEDLRLAKRIMHKSDYQDLSNRVRREQRGETDVVIDYGVAEEYSDEIRVYGTNEEEKKKMAKITEQVLRNRKKNRGMDI